MADNDNRYRLWQTISKEYDLPDYNQFSKDMEDATKRKSLHDAVSAEYDLPDFDQFSKDMGYGQQTTQQTTPQGNQNTQNGKKPQQTTQSSQVEEGRGVLGDNGYNKQKIAHEKEASQAWNNLAYKGGIKWTIEGHPEVKMVAVTDDLVKRFPQLEQWRGYQVPFNMSTGTPIMQNIDDKGNIITPDEASEQYTKILTNQDFDYVPKQETAAVQIGSVVNTALSTKGGWLDRAVQKAMEENYGKDWKDRKYESDGKEISASEIYAKAKQGIYDNINGVLGDIRKSLLFSTDEQRRQTVDELYQKGYLKEDFLPKANALHYISNVDKGEQVEELRQRRLKLQVQREVIMDKLNQIPQPDHAENMAEFYARRANDGSELYASDLRKIDKQIAQYDAVIDELEGRNNLKSEWGHAVQTSGITDIGAWDFGVTDLKDAMMMYPLAKKMQNGDTITQDDYISLKLLSQANEADAVENAVMPSSYNMFKGSLQSVPFTVQFLAGGEFAKGATAVIDKAATRTVKGAILKAGGKKALKAAEKVAEKAADSKILKFCGMLGKDFRQAFVMENTTGAATTGAEILNRHIGTVSETDDGFKMEGESLPTAIIKGEVSQNIELQTEFLGEHFPSSLKFIRGMAHTKVGSAMGLRNLAAWLTKVSRMEFATTLKSYATRAGINGVFGEYLEEVAGTAENALLVGDQKFSDLLDVKQQEEVAGSVVLSCLGMGIFGTAIYTGQRGLNMPSYYRLQHLQNKWDNAGLDLFTGEDWAKWKERIDNTPNEGMKSVMADILRADNMTEEQARAAFNYARCSLTLRGMNIGAIKAAQLGLTDDRSIEQDNAYVEGRQAKDEEKHDIQIEFEDRSHELAEKLGITEQQLDNMSDEELESLIGKDDQLDNLIYDYQTSHAKYQGVVDNADDEIDKAAQEAARQTDMATDKSRGTVRNATIKATKGEEDYGVYIVSGNVATNEDGSINVGESDDMILYYDPKTGKIEHCDALRLAALGEEVNAEETRNQAIADAKEKAIRKQAGIIDGTVGEGTTFTITDAQGVEHTYEVLAENGDGSAMITLDGNVQETPVSLQDLQNLKDAEDAKSLEAAKMQRQQYEEEREKRNAPVEDNLDYADIINTNGEVEIADVVDEEGNPMFPDAEEVFFVQNQGNRAKVMVLDNEGNLKAKLVDKSAVQSLGTMSVDEYKQERQKTLKEAENESEPSLVDETETSNNVVPTDNVATDNTTTNETQPGNEAEVTTPNETQNEGDLNASNEQESTPKITLEDGTEVPMLEDGNPDFSQLTAGQVAELYDTQFGEDAGQIITNNVDRSKKALDKANAMKVSGGSFVEQKASKEAKDKAIAEAQAKYDSAKAIEDAYNERMLVKEEDTPEGRQNLIEKARRKFNRMKSSVKDNAQAVAQLYNETVGSLLHRLYDSTGIDVFDDTANTVDEYVASSIAPYSLNYEGTETSKGVKQETGLSRADFAKTGFLAKEGKGKTIDQLSNDLWRDRPENLQNITDQDVRNAIIDLITSGQTAFGLKNHIQNLRIAEAENILEQQKRQADELAHAEKQKEEESQSTGMVDNNAEDASNADVTPADEQAEDNLSDMPFEAPSPDENAPFSAKDKAKDPLEVWNNMTDEEKAAYIEQNRVKDTRLVDDVVGKKLRKAIEKIAGMMGANIQWQRTDMIRNGWFNPTTKTIYLALDSSILEGVQFVFGHEMTHDIKKKSPAMYDELKGLVKEKYGEELFEAITNKNEKRYADVDKNGNDRSYYEEETVADAIGKMINDLNLTRSIALKMSHPLLAKIHDVLLKIKNALMATPYTDDVKGIIRTIEQVYVKTANGTFESSASEGTNDEQFSVRDANERFNNEIENFKNKSHKGLLHLGTPSPILKACGVDVDEITLSPKVLNRKLNQHSLTTEDVKDLVNAIQKPIMVYKHGEEAPNIVVITNADIRGNKLSLSLELDADGNVTKLNNVSSIHDKDAETEINRWLSWDEGYLEKALRWVDKEKVSDWISSARLNSYSQTENNQKLSSIAKILNDFENPNISEENISNDDENVLYSLRQKPEPENKGIGYKVFVLGKDGKLYPPMVANPNGAATPVGVWLDADAAPIAGESKTGRPQVKQGGKGTQGGSGKLAYRPGWHLGVIPYAIQFNRKDAEGNKTLFPKNFVFAEVEYAADKDYQDEAHAEGINSNGKYQHSLAGLKHLPTDGYYMYRTNPNPETDPWVITGAMKVNRLLTRAEQADIVRKAGREPQKIQEGDIVTDDVVNSINQEIAAAPKFSLKVYHGSGADFTEFDFDHMGEGAGSQAFGWGGYVTSSKKIGKNYADALRDKAEEMGEHHNQVEVEKALMDEYKEMGMDNDEWMPDKETRIKGFNYFARGYADRSFDNDIRAFRLNESTRSDYNSYVEYTKLGGEVEARNVQSRMNMSPEERRKLLAEETEDVARKDQIFLYGDNDAYSLKQNKDAEYLEAVRNGDMEKAQKMVYDAARAAGYVNGTDYQGEGSWNAPSASVEKKDFANLDALRESVEEYSGDTNVFGIINGVTTNDDDFYYNPGRVGFRDAAASETSSVLRRLRYDKADANTKVKVYRTVPADVKGNKLMSGDWIALSKQYCIEHGNGRYGEGGYRIIEEEVPIKTIWNDGNDMREFGFDDGNNNEAEKNVPNNRKLLDAVTYDNNGNVIPLSERFNESNDDIRYSLKNKDRKQAQMDIILKTNPMLDDYHTGIRKVEDIKTLEESVGEARSEAEKYGDEEWSAYPDITNDMLQNALETGEITIYSSKPIKNGVFVTPSYMQASDYAGGGNVYEKTVPLTDVAWINTDEGQYAKVDGERMPYQDSIEADKMSLKGIAEGKVESLSELSERLKEMKTSDEVDNAITNAVDAMPEGWRQANKKTINIARAIAEDRKAEMNGEDPKFSLKKIGGSLIKGGTYFSGGGLVEEGLKGIVDPVIAVEYDEKISGVYRNNFGNHIVTADVRDVDPKELVDKIDGDVEYFHASPVCKNYSLAKNNHEELELDKETAASTAEFISKVRPKVVTIENVKGYKDSEAMKTITDALDEAGYKWDANVYNAADYGGYTNRERLIVRAVRDGELPAKPQKQERKSGWYEAVEDIIPTLTEKKNGVASWMDERLKADGIDWRHIDKPLYVMGSGYANGTVPHAFADELLPTLRTKSGDVIVMPDGKVYRAMGRVLARVSGVSDDYQMPASEALSHTIIGNGIPTQLTENVIAPLVRDVLHPAVEERASLKDVNEEEKYSLRVDRYRDELNQWKKDNNLPKDAERPQLPVREPNESAADFLKRVKEYRKQAALWATAPTYEDHLLTSDTAQGQFNLEMQRKAVLTRIVVQDSMLAIRKAQEAIMKEHGVDKLNPAEDAYTAENRSHGKAKNEFEEYNDEFLQPLRKAYNELMLRLGKSYDNVKVYMIAKHGLERNAHIAFKYALDEDFETNEERMDAYNNYKSDMDRLNNDADFEAGRIDFATWKQRDGNIRTKYAPSYFKFRFDENGKTMDYSGLSALFDADDYEGAAADLVKDVEDANPYFTDELWYATNDATKKILRDSYNAGMMTEDNFNFVSGMYRNYIPLRGWGDTNADQVWNYVGGGKGAFSQVVKEAKGRKSLADDPIAYIENMAESAILMNNRNWVKQHLLLLAQNHRTSLLHVSKAWYIKTKDAQGNEEWIPASPQITEGMTSRQVELALEAFEQKMEQMKQNGEATQKREHLEISYPQTNGEEREHEVRVMKGGEEYVIYVNGDPQLAQAVNNTRARKVREGLESSLSAKVIARTGRYMAAAYTSMSPLFIPSNYMRDLTMTLASTAIREDARYNYLLRRNMLRHWNTFPMVLSYQNGTLREKVRNGSASEVEKMFYDFMMNGGETGFVTSVDVEDLKKKFRKDLKDLNRMAANPKKVGHIIMDSIETLNRAIEDSNRFMVYMTSIQYGRSIEEAVNNAKDVTLNFNRKGTGEHWMQNIRNLYLFINPAIQSLQTLGALAKHHRFKFTAVTTGWLATGLLAPMLNNLLMSFFGGDDDKDKYWQFTKWDRRNNFIMWIPFTNEFVIIPLAQEFRGFYGVGDMIASKLWGGEKAEESWSDYAWDLAGQIVDMLPLDPTGYDGDVLIALMPNVFRPIFELGDNVDFTGKPIFRNSEYNKYDPNFTKAYVGTPDWLVRISKMVNSIDNKYPDVEQNAIDRFGDPRFNLNNPAVVDHVLSSYLGGAYTMGSQILGVATKALNGDDIKMADIPLASKFVSNPDDRPVSKKQGEEFWDMKERHDRAANTLSKLKQKAKVDGDYSTLDIFFGSDEYRQYKEDDKKVKKYEEDRKKEKAQETGVEYRPHKITADDVYKSHATPKDDFEDMKMKQLYEKLNSYKIRYEAIDGISSEKGDAYYKANKAAIDAIEEIAYDKSMISTIKKGFLSDGQDSYDADGMKDIREMRKRILDVLEKANKTMMNNRK